MSVSSGCEIERLDALFAPWDRMNAPGVIVGVSRNDVPVYRRGFGMASMETNVLNSPATRVRIASMTKQFTSLLALLAADDGSIELDTTIRTYLPELTGPGGDPTLRQLLQHRGGSRCYLDLSTLALGAAVAPIGAALAAQVRQVGRNFAPGDAMIYNNGGYHLISLALERVAGISFERQLRERIFEPVGMYDTASVPSDYQITPGIATNHILAPDGSWRRGLHNFEDCKGSGAVVSSVDDMLRWAGHLRRRDVLTTPQIWDALTELPTFPDGTTGSYALGLIVETYRGLRIIHHGGSWTGASSVMLTVPDHGIDIVILANGAPSANPLRLAEQIIDIILEDCIESPAPGLAVNGYESLIGLWWSPETAMLYNFVDDAGILKIGVCGNPVASEIVPGSSNGVASRSLAGDIALELQPALGTGHLDIRFAGQTAVYRKLSAERTDTEAFALAAAGRYYSHDADCFATVKCSDNGCTITFSEPLGRVEWALVILSATVARIETTSFVPRYGVLTLTIDEEPAPGFIVNTARTRNLRFTRFDGDIDGLLSARSSTAA